MTEEKANVPVFIVDVNHFDHITVGEFISKLQEFNLGHQIRFDCHTSYDIAYCSFEVYRDETDEEFELRKKNIEKRRKIITLQDIERAKRLLAENGINIEAKND